MQLRENYHPATTHEEILYALYLQQIRTNELLEKLVPKEPYPEPEAEVSPVEEKPKRHRKANTTNGAL